MILSFHRSNIGKIKTTIPGDRLAVIEEFKSSEGTYTDRDIIRAFRLGVANFDNKRKEIKVKPSQKLKNVPNVGDNIIGQVDVFQGNLANVKIYYINDKRSYSGFTGMLILRSGSSPRKRRKTIMCKLGDIIRAKVTSKENAIIHLSINSGDNGILYATCSSCGGGTERFDQKIKCTNCGSIEERKLASDFSKADLK